MVVLCGQEEEERKKKEEQEKKEAEEYDQWKGMFEVDAGGSVETDQAQVRAWLLLYSLACYLGVFYPLPRCRV